MRLVFQIGGFMLATVAMQGGRCFAQESDDNVRKRNSSNSAVLTPAITDIEGQLTITLTGRVQVYQGAILYFGDQVTYDYGKNQLDTTGMKVSLDPFILEAEELETINYKGKPAYIGRNAGITTHDVEEPNFWLRAKKITIYPDSKVTLGSRLSFHSWRKVELGFVSIKSLRGTIRR